jgi:hypothetical protein
LTGRPIQEIQALQIDCHAQEAFISATEEMQQVALESYQKEMQKGRTANDSTIAWLAYIPIPSLALAPTQFKTTPLTKWFAHSLFTLEDAR